MRRILFLCLLLCCCLTMMAKVVVAHVDSYNSASLSGDGAEEMSVTFMSDSESKGKVLGGKSAVLTISNMPACTISQITLWMKSNKNAGSADVELTIGEASILVASGAYADWPGIGGYSSDYLPIITTGHWNVTMGGQMVLRIDGKVNSVYLDRMEVEYVEKAPVPHAVTLQWYEGTDTHTYTISESQAGKGILLPSCGSDIHCHVGKWHWEGWTLEQTAISSEKKACLEGGQIFYPQHDTTLYALYSDAQSYELHVDTSKESKEYVMVFPFADCMAMAEGYWINKRLSSSCVSMYEDDMEYVLKVDTISDDARYICTFMGDSVTIRHARSDMGIGYNKSGATSNLLPWAWKRAKGGSMFFYHDLDTMNIEVLSMTEILGYSISPSYNDDFTAIEFIYGPVLWDENSTYMLLFDPVQVPPHSDSHWTTHPTVTALVNPLFRSTGERKYIENGQIWIEHHGVRYDIFGRVYSKMNKIER